MNLSSISKKILGALAPNWIYEPKPVTVRVPSGALPNHDETWQGAFRGRGSTGGGLVIEAIIGE
jgi:hypothetical protein